MEVRVKLRKVRVWMSGIGARVWMTMKVRVWVKVRV